MFVNAWQAMPNGGTLVLQTENSHGQTGKSGAAPSSDRRYVKITIGDTGFGMDPETQKHIFEPFFTTKEKGRGTGLGLASAYGIIHNHRGFISLTSEKNIGTKFYIYLPATDKIIMKSESPEKSIHRGQGTILLIDDETIVTTIGVEMLESLGYQVIEANTGPEALRIYERYGHAIDLVILDIIMPGMGGNEVYHRLKSINPEIKVLLSSGYSLDDQASAIIKQGCRGFIQKPFGLQQLSGKISEILNSG